MAVDCNHQSQRFLKTCVVCNQRLQRGLKYLLIAIYTFFFFQSQPLQIVFVGKVYFLAPVFVGKV